MNFKARIGTAVASSALLLQLLTPAAFADTTITVSGNGASSNNTAHVESNSTTNVTQNSTTVVGVDVTTTANSGGNQANNNTGAVVGVTSGDAAAVSGVTVTGGSNNATVTGCGCASSTDIITVSGNGFNSDNMVHLSKTSSVKASQTGTALVSGTVTTKAKSGKNKANGNTGGMFGVSTGGASAVSGFGFTMPTNNLTLNP
jgi:fibronectin-binding autotransporter adhesin